MNVIHQDFFALLAMKISKQMFLVVVNKLLLINVLFMDKMINV